MQKYDASNIAEVNGLRLHYAVAGEGRPVLLVHGTADDCVPVSCSIEAQKAYADAELVLIPDDTHCFDLHLDQAVEAVRTWMLKKII